MSRLLIAAVFPLVLGCATQSEAVARDQWQAAMSQPARQDAAASGGPSHPGAPHSAATSSGAAEPAANPGNLSQYVAIALEQSPQLQAAFQRWRASVHRITQTRRLPDPKLSFGYFIRPVETRVGPQRARLGLSQSFPWPTKLTAGADAASQRARAQQSQFEALALDVRWRVAVAYYRLWLLRATRELHKEHLEVLRSLSETVLARLEIGSATLADLQQVNLSAARLEDLLAGMAEDESAAGARLRAAVGNRTLANLPTAHGPSPAVRPLESEAKLVAAALAHPLLESFDHQAASQEHSARAEEAGGLPTFSLGADWILTGDADMPNTADSGRDAVIVGGGLSIPLWRQGYEDAADAARAEANATRLERAAAEDRALAELQIAQAQVRDAVRRVDVHRHTLVPQADSAYASVLGAYVAGQGTLGQTLLAQQMLLDLRQQLERARARYGMAWARLERVTGKALTPSPQHATNRKEADDRK